MKTKEQMITPTVKQAIQQHFMRLINVTDLVMHLMAQDLSVLELTSDSITVMSDSDAASVDFVDFDNAVYPLRLTITVTEVNPMKVFDLAELNKPLLAQSNLDDCVVWLHPAFPAEFVGFPYGCYPELKLDNLTAESFPYYYAELIVNSRVSQVAYGADDYQVIHEFK